MRTTGKTLTAAIVVTMLLLPQTQANAATSNVSKQVAAAKVMLNKLAIVRPSAQDYDRTGQFGDTWADVNNDGCDTRNDILERDLIKEQFKDSCLVATGILKDPYTSKTINFVRGVGTSTKVQIDHVIALHLAWQYGATKWSFGKRVTFANDPINLIATDGPTNGSKSDSGPDEWLPPNKSYRCTYVIRFIRIAYLYKVGINASMKSVMRDTLSSCTKVVGSPATLTPLARSYWDRAAAIG